MSYSSRRTVQTPASSIWLSLAISLIGLSAIAIVCYGYSLANHLGRKYLSAINATLNLQLEATAASHSLPENIVKKPQDFFRDARTRLIRASRYVKIIKENDTSGNDSFFIHAMAIKPGDAGNLLGRVDNTLQAMQAVIVQYGEQGDSRMSEKILMQKYQNLNGRFATDIILLRNELQAESASLEQVVAKVKMIVTSAAILLVLLIVVVVRCCGRCSNSGSFSDDSLSKGAGVAANDAKSAQGIIPICGYCRKIRGREGGWGHLEEYIANHLDIQLSHGICPDCYKAQLGSILGWQKEENSIQEHSDKPLAGGE